MVSVLLPRMVERVRNLWPVETSTNATELSLGWRSAFTVIGLLIKLVLGAGWSRLEQVGAGWRRLAQVGAGWRKSALTRFEARVGLADNIDTPLTTNDLAVGMAAFERFE